jgi:glycogen debranching enzyme
MDARVGEREITPRIGKPVEIQALWLNALWIGGRNSRRWRSAFEMGREAFRVKFWNPSRQCLFDVIDADHRHGEVDDSIRPNQIFAVGGLPITLLEMKQARQVVDVVEAKLWTPMGLRSLSPGHADYVGRYAGGPAQRDAAYHQGTVWPWLIGAFVEAWLRVRGNTTAAKLEARERFVQPLLELLECGGAGGIGHVGEIADGDVPHRPNGCPFQAWSAAELLRIDHLTSQKSEPISQRAGQEVGASA